MPMTMLGNLGVKVALTLLVAASAATVLIFFAGVTGLLFEIWPTKIGDHPIHIGASKLNEISELRALRKFEPDTERHYPGAPSALVRLEAQVAIDDALSEIISLGEGEFRKAQVIAIVKRHLRSMKNFDTEEREQACSYLAHALRILGVENSAGLFSVFLHGLPLDLFVRRAPDSNEDRN
jgi:hypothetical protein